MFMLGDRGVASSITGGRARPNRGDEVQRGRSVRRGTDSFRPHDPAGAADHDRDLTQADLQRLLKRHVEEATRVIACDEH
jgi:hypothetical protein